MKRNELEAIGIFDESFEFHTVSALVKAGILERPIDGNHGEIHPKGEDFVSTGVPFLMASDIANGMVDYESCKFITAKQADGLRKGFARNGDVLLTHKATIGRTAIVDYHAHPYVMLTPQVTYYRVRDKKRLSNRYLRLYFESSFFQSVLGLWAGSGATRAYLGITEQGKLPIVLPPFDKQQKLAAVLSAYDDLIENNRRRIVLLERITEQLYREWFVRFRFPRRQGVAFKNGVPAHWAYLPIGEVCSVIKRGISPVYENGAASRAINQRCIRDGDVDLSLARRHATKVPKDKYIKFGDILINSTGVGTLGRVALVDDKMENVTCDSHVTICRANPSGADSLYLGHTIKNLQSYFESMASGSTGQSELGRSTIANTRILVAPLELQREFARCVVDFQRQRRCLKNAIDTLVRSRDLLLPRLISGKLRVDQLDIQFPPSMQAKRA